MKLYKMVTPTIAGKSLVKIDRTLNWPTPGQSNIDSTRKVPPSIRPKLNPTTVETGISVFLYPDFLMISLFFIP